MKIKKIRAEHKREKEFTVSENPENFGVIERYNHTVAQKASSFFADSKFSKT